MRQYALLAAMILAGLPMAGRAEPVADFYRGKQISLLIGFPPGGGYDIYARAFAPYFARHIPGNPTVLVQNMEGGVGVRAASFLANASSQNGTTLGMFLDGLSLSKILGGPGAFDPVKFAWIGRIVSTATFTMVSSSANATSIAEAKGAEITIGATSASSSSSYVPMALNDLIGTKFRIIRGYTGAPPISLAMERGEVDAHGGLALEVIQTSKKDWLETGKAKFLYYLGAHSHPAVLSAPGLLDLATDQKSRNILGLLAGAVDVGRALAAEPSAPPERIAALRKAFMEAVNDPEFIADAKAHQLSVEPLSGEQVQAIIRDAAATPPEMISVTNKYFTP